MNLFIYWTFDYTKLLQGSIEATDFQKSLGCRWSLRSSEVASRKSQVKIYSFLICVECDGSYAAADNSQKILPCWIGVQ